MNHHDTEAARVAAGQPADDVRGHRFLLIEGDTHHVTTGGALVADNPLDDDVRAYVETAFVGQFERFGGGAAGFVTIVRLPNREAGIDDERAVYAEAEDLYAEGGEEYAAETYAQAKTALVKDGAFCDGRFVREVARQAACMVDSDGEDTLADAFRTLAGDMNFAAVVIEGGR